jgi:homoserine dehydrogenase
MGIMNGTTNFILDAMTTDKRDFDEVLKEAQALGYAEANPSADVDGLDTARKTAISSSIAFNTIIKEENVSIFVSGFPKVGKNNFVKRFIGKIFFLSV